MSFLAWAFAAAALAVGFPLLFHLIRKTPRGRQEFSSLMFLKPSPPRLTRRSRLDNLLLLLIRATVIVLLAIAFMRPFLRQSDQIVAEQFAARKVAILIDVSASMRRGGTWKHAMDHLDEVLNGLQPSDDIALYAFSDDVQTVVDFDVDRSIDLQVDEKANLIRSELRSLSATWGATNLGLALSEAADRLQSSVDGTSRLMQIELISDLQSGAAIDALQAYQWPEDIRVRIHQVVGTQRSNANVRLLDQSDESTDADAYRVRVFNDGLSETDQFFVGWADQDNPADRKSEVPFYVAAGTSRVLEVPREGAANRADRLILRGDSTTYDNEFFVSPIKQKELQVMYVGPDKPDDPNAMLFYLTRCFAQTVYQQVNVEGTEKEAINDADLSAVDLMVVSDVLEPQQVQQLDEFVVQGGTVLVVLADAEQTANIEDFVGVESAPQRKIDDFALLAEIEFQHPLLQIFDSPQYSDFTNIHFWSYVPVRLQDADVAILARFDSNDPAMWVKSGGKGKVYCLASGWHPDQSQLALSTKFVPLMNTLLHQASGMVMSIAGCKVNEPFQFPFKSDSDWTIDRPDGSQVVVKASETHFRETDLPGNYTVASIGTDPFTFSVNLANAESRIAPMNQEQLESFGVLVGNQPSQVQQSEEAQRIKDAELEGRQKIWKWLIVAAMMLIVMEIIMAAMSVRQEETAETLPASGAA